MIILKIILVIIVIAVAVGVLAAVADLLGKKSPHKPYGPYERFVKRGLDAFLATGALIVLSPVLLITAILVRMKLGSPVLFTQERPGRDGKIFKLIVRTMLPPKGGVIDPAQDAARLTPFGKKLRSTSLDELPELINVIKGDMAVSHGPSRSVPADITYTRQDAMKYALDSPLAQVHGRNAISWEEKFDWDVSMLITSHSGDVKIILETVRTVLKEKVSAAANQPQMTEFGSAEK